MDTPAALKCKVVSSYERFDYSTLETTSAAFVEGVAAKVRQHQKRLSAEIIALGLDLIRAQDVLGRGQFGRWLELEFGWTVRTAFNYMQAARIFGTKSETVSELPVKTIYLLSASSTPREIRDTVVAKLEADEPVDHDQIKRQIEQAGRERRERLRHQRAGQRRTKQYQQRRQKERDAEAEREAERRRAATSRARDLIERYGVDTVREIASALNDWYVQTAISEEIGG